MKNTKCIYNNCNGRAIAFRTIFLDDEEEGDRITVERRYGCSKCGRSFMAEELYTFMQDLGSTRFDETPIREEVEELEFVMPE